MSKKMAKLLSMFLALLLILTSAAGCGKKNVPDENATGNTGANGAAAGEAAADKTADNAADDAPAAGGEEQLTLTFWHTYGDGEAAQFENIVLPMWEQVHPNVKIEAVRQDSSQYHQMIVTAFGTGQAPDVARIDIVNTASYAKQGGLVDLNSFDDFNASKESFLEGPLSTNLYKGSYYGLPLDTNCKKSKTEDRSQ